MSAIDFCFRIRRFLYIAAFNSMMRKGKIKLRKIATMEKKAIPQRCGREVNEKFLL